MKIKAELKKVEAVKSASLDMVYKFTMVTEDNRVLALGSMPADTVFDVEVDADG